MSDKAHAPERLWTIPQVAQFYQVDDRTIRRLIPKRNVPFITIGRQIRIRPEHIPLFGKKEW